jgi:hypothetical protein
MIDRAKAHKYHNVNLQAIGSTLTQVALSAKLAIRQRRHKELSFHNKLYCLLLGAWAEVRLQKLLNDTGGFSKTDLKIINAEDKQFSKWRKCIEIAFQHKYQCALDKLPKTASMRFDLIVKYMNDHLEPIIRIRNRLAHGQWIYVFNSDLTDIEQNALQYLNQQNILTLQFKMDLLDAIAKLIHDLVVSKPTFERDFDSHCRKIDSIESNIRSRSYKAYVQSLLKRQESGVRKRGS